MLTLLQEPKRRATGPNARVGDCGRWTGAAGRAGAGGRMILQRVLVVGELGGAALPLTPWQVLRFAEIDEVGAELLDAVRPDIVLSPLLSRSFDCVDLAQILSFTGFRGRYRAVAPRLPQPELIVAEIGQLCPDIAFDLIEVAGFRGLRC